MTKLLSIRLVAILVGLGFAVVVKAAAADAIAAQLNAEGIRTWQLGIIESTPCDLELPGYVTEAKGVRGGAVGVDGLAGMASA